MAAKNTNGDGNAAVVGPIDPVTAIRRSPVIDAASVPVTPRDFRPLDAGQKNGLYKVSGDQHAEVREGLAELVGRGGTIQQDLGRFAPNPDEAAALLTRMIGVHATRALVESLLLYCDEQEDVVHHDSMAMLLRAQTEVKHVAEHEPGILDRYPKVMALAAQRSQAISDGIARKAAERRANGNGNGNGKGANGAGTVVASSVPQPPAPVESDD